MFEKNNYIQETVSNLKNTFNIPILNGQIKISYFNGLKENNVKDVPEELYPFLENLTYEYINAINLQFLNDEVQKVINDIKSLSEDDFNDIKIINDELEFSKANDIIQKIYKNINDLQVKKEVVCDYVTIMVKAKNYLNQLSKAIQAIARDTTICSGWFAKISERDRFIEPLTSDIDSVISVLQGNIMELSNLEDKVIKSRLNILLRADSAIRMLSKYREFDWEANKRQSNCDYNDGDFNVEKI